MNSSLRRDRFKRLWPKRLQKAIWHIQSIGKLSEKTNYIYKTEEIEIIQSQLSKILKEAMARFDNESPSDIGEGKHGISNQVVFSLVDRTDKLEKENKRLKSQIRNIDIKKDALNEEILHLHALITRTADRLSREIGHVKSSGRLAIPKL